MSDHPTTLTEAERQAVTDCDCGHDIGGYHNGNGCYHKDYPAPGQTVSCDCRETDDRAPVNYAAAERIKADAYAAGLRTPTATGDDLLDRVTALATRRPAPPTPASHAFVSDFAAGWHYALSELRAALAASPAPVVSRPEATCGCGHRECPGLWTGDGCPMPVVSRPEVEDEVVRLRAALDALTNLADCAPDCGERAACPDVTSVGHWQCGVCPDCEIPRHHCGHLATDPDAGGDS